MQITQLQLAIAIASPNFAGFAPRLPLEKTVDCVRKPIFCNDLEVKIYTFAIHTVSLRLLHYINLKF